MSYQISLSLQNYEEVLESFSAYLNNVNQIINSIKESIYELLNVHLHISAENVQPNIASVSVNGRMTLNDLKRVSSILRGYSMSKVVKRQDQSIKKQRIQNSMLQQDSQSRVSRYSHPLNNTSITQFHKSFIKKKKTFEQVTFLLPKEQQLFNVSFATKPKNNLSQRNLSLPSHSLGLQQRSKNEILQNFNFPMSKTQNISQYLMRENNLKDHKKANYSEKGYCNKKFSVAIAETEGQFKYCLEKHNCDVDHLIKTNKECLEILNDLQKNLKKKSKNSKKQKKIILEPKQKLASAPCKLSEKISNQTVKITPKQTLKQIPNEALLQTPIKKPALIGYRAMTPSSNKAQKLV